MLKILAGTAKGRSIQTLPKHAFVRPILARIKKSVFDILAPRLKNSRFLDLYAGIGTVGLEALSRGAAKVCLVEQDRACVNVVQNNLENLGLSDRGTIYRASVVDDLSFLPKPFDIIFMGPPYKDEQKKALALVMPTLETVLRAQLVTPETIVLAQHHKKEPVEAQAPWEMYRREIYGDSIVSFFRLAR